MNLNSLAKKFSYELKKKKIKLCLAESITGGMLASEITKIKGASDFFEFSIVCYSNQSKSSFLDIQKQIKKENVVSSQIAELMSKKIIKYSKSKNILAISCTGLASNDLKKKYKVPVGTVFIGITYKNNTKVYKKKIISISRINTIKLVTKEMIIKSLENINH